MPKRSDPLPLVSIAALLAGVAFLLLAGAPGRSPLPARALEPVSTGPAALLERLREHLPFRDRLVEELEPAWHDAEVLATGRLDGAELAGVGGVQLLRLGQQTRLVLRDFDLDFAPGLQVVLSPAAEPRSYAQLGATLPLGELRSAAGRQSFPIPAGTPVEAYRSVAVVAPAERVAVVVATLLFRS